MPIQNSSKIFFKKNRDKPTIFNMRKGFIFDFDGTIGETIPLVLASLEAAFADLQMKAPNRDEIQSHFGPNERGLCKVLFPNSPDLAESLYSRYLFHYENMHEKFSPTPFYGIAEALKTLSENGISLAIVTGKGDDSAKISLEKYGVGDLFSLIECGSEKGAVKPEKINAVLKAWNTDTKESKIYYVGDAVQDVFDSLEVGAIPISAAWSKLAPITELKKSPTSKVFEKVDDFRKWILDEII